MASSPSSPQTGSWVLYPLPPNKGITRRQTDGQNHEYFLPHVNTFPDCAGGGFRWVELQCLLAWFCSLDSHYSEQKLSEYVWRWRLRCRHTVKLLSRPLNTAFYLCQFSINLQCWSVYQTWKWARPSVYLMSLTITLNAPVNFASGWTVENSSTISSNWVETKKHEIKKKRSRLGNWRCINLKREQGQTRASRLISTQHTAEKLPAGWKFTQFIPRSIPDAVKDTLLDPDLQLLPQTNLT